MEVRPLTPCIKVFWNTESHPSVKSLIWRRVPEWSVLKWTLVGHIRLNLILFSEMNTVNINRNFSATPFPGYYCFKSRPCPRGKLTPAQAMKCIFTTGHFWLFDTMIKLSKFHGVTINFFLFNCTFSCSCRVSVSTAAGAGCWPEYQESPGNAGALICSFASKLNLA